MFRCKGPRTRGRASDCPAESAIPLPCPCVMRPLLRAPLPSLKTLAYPPTPGLAAGRSPATPQAPDLTRIPTGPGLTIHHLNGIHPSAHASSWLRRSEPPPPFRACPCSGRLLHGSCTHSDRTRPPARCGASGLGLELGQDRQQRLCCAALLAVTTGARRGRGGQLLPRTRRHAGPTPVLFEFPSIIRVASCWKTARASGQGCRAALRKAIAPPSPPLADPGVS